MTEEKIVLQSTEELIAEIGGGENITLPPNTKRLGKCLDIRDILKTDYGDINWIVKDLIEKDTLTALSGDPGNFKTWLTMELAKAIAGGTKFLGHFDVEQSPVLVIDEENQDRYIQRRYRQIGADENLPIYYYIREGIKVDESAWVNELVQTIRDKDIGFIIVDSLVRVHSGEENDSKFMRVAFEAFKKLSKEGVSILFTHHHRKSNGSDNGSQAMRGTSDISASIDIHFTIRKEKDADRVLIKQQKSRHSVLVEQFAADIIIDKQADTLNLRYSGKHEKKEQELEDIQDAIIYTLESCAGKDMSVKDIIDELQQEESYSKAKIIKTLKGLVSEKLVSERKAQSNKSMYSLQDKSSS